jgi:hypothetical protein
MWKRIVPAVLLIWFLAQTVQALLDHSYVGFFLIGNANSATQLMMLDLVLALGLFLVWMVGDARARQGSYLPFVGITLFFGVAGPLLYLVGRGWGRRRERLVALVLLVALAAVALTSWSYADLRTPESARASAEAADQGRALLRRAATSHGLDAWRGYSTMETTVTDVWSQGGWWPLTEQRFRSQALLGTFTSRVELLDGPAAGEIWGVQGWAPYRAQHAGAAVAFLDEPAPEITFYLPTLQYFNELPFRLLDAETVLYAGRARHRGRGYERVFVTWGSPEAHAEHDQYLLWIDAETLLVRMVRYTVRDAVSMIEGPMRAMMKSLAAGTIHFDDYRLVDGVMVPFEHTVTLAEPRLTQYPVHETFYHRLVVEEVRFDPVPPGTLIPEPQRATPADRKPAEAVAERAIETAPIS